MPQNLAIPKEPLNCLTALGGQSYKQSSFLGQAFLTCENEALSWTPFILY